MCLLTPERVCPAHVLAPGSAVTRPIRVENSEAVPYPQPPAGICRAPGNGRTKGTWPLDIAERVAAVRAIFRCGDREAALLDKLLDYQTFANKAPIAHQGDASAHCCFVVDGAVRIQAIGIDGRGQQLAQNGPGEMFGAYPEPTTHRADIVAHGKTHLLRADARAIAALAAEHAAIGSAMAILIARQLDMALDRMVARTTYTAAGRVHAQLLQLADDSHRISPAPFVTTIALTANTTRETASRALAALVRRGIVRREEGDLVIASPRMLAEMVY